jgi:hypothetical protein
MTEAALPALHRPPLALVAALAALAVLAIPMGALLAQSQAAPFTVVETGQSFNRLQQAVDAIGDSRGTIAIAAGRYSECAVQTAGVVSFLAANPGTAIFDGRTCEGKAALVLRGRGAEVSGLVFENMRVADFNGAGIRLEKGDLTVAQSWFRDSQQGILTAADPAGRIVIDRSTFTRLGTCDGPGGCAHSIYVGEYGQLRVTRSRFEEGRGGHYVKSRATRAEIASSSFDDSRGQATNYMIDLPKARSARSATTGSCRAATRRTTRPSSRLPRKARRTRAPACRSSPTTPAWFPASIARRCSWPTGRVMRWRSARTRSDPA